MFDRFRNNSAGRGGGGSSGNDRKGDGKGGKGKMHWNTPDGRAICFKFNNKGQKRSCKCGRVHVCQVCFSDQHPAYDCPRRRGAAAKKK